MDDAIYQDELRNFIREILPIVIPEDGVNDFGPIHDKFLTTESMATWTKAFTHPSVEPNIDENYEVLELLGDRNMTAAFVIYLYEIYNRQITESELSELNRAYLSTKMQSKLSVFLGLPGFLISEEKELLIQNPKIQEDLLESFAGALLVLGNKLIGNTYGYLMVYNLVVYLFSNVDIDFSQTLGDVKTQVKEIIENLPYGNARDVNSMIRTTTTKDADGENYYTSVITVPKEVREHYNSLHPQSKIPDTPIAKTEGKLKAESEKAAFAQALIYLNKIFPRETILRFNRSIRLDPDLLEAVNERRKELGYMELQVVRARDDFPVFQLIGLRPDGRKDIILTNKRTNQSSDQQQENLLRNFVEI